MMRRLVVNAQLKFTCSYSTIETLEKGVCSKLAIKHQNDVTDVVLVFLLLTLNIFHKFSNVSIVDFEQVNITWVGLGNL